MRPRAPPDSGVFRVHQVAADGQPFVSDMCTVGRLADIHALGWNVSRRVDIFRELCAAIASLQAGAVSHGALTPDNIMLDDHFRPALAAHALTSSEGDSFVAPEGQGSARAEVFSLGKILDFLIRGEQPATTSERAELSQAGALDERLARVVRRATSSDPAARYPSVEALLDDLDGGRAGLSTHRAASGAHALEPGASQAARLDRLAANDENRTPRTPVVATVACFALAVAVVALSLLGLLLVRG